MIYFLFACSPTEPTVDDVVFADIFVDQIGDPVPFLDDELRERYEKGAKVMTHAFDTADGVGPFFNADSCASCHQAPVAGGSGPRYRDLWLVLEERWDGAMVAAGTNGQSPVRNLYATPPVYHVPESDEVDLYARRNTPSGFGVGLFAFIEDEEIFSRVDPEDDDGDGISGRVNFEQGQVGRFGYKSQAATMESFNRGAMFNQMGITTNPLFFEFPELQARLQWMDLFISSAWAQVSAPDEPTVDDDGIPDPEMSDEDQLNLLVFSTYSGVLPVVEEPKGKELFMELGCGSCHTPHLPSKVGILPAYTDLLLHDMGEEMADGLSVGFATGSEFRTQPLWGVVLHPPFLHDGRADTLQEAIEWHGGEGAASRERWMLLDDAEQEVLLSFLEGLGGTHTDGNILYDDDKGLPSVGTMGGSRRDLSPSEEALFQQGAEVFDKSVIEDMGLNAHFNADSCRACHQDPILGGAGGLDVNVLRYGFRDPESGEYTSLSESVLPRSALWTELPAKIDAQANIVEWRNPPLALGMGYFENRTEAEILAFADPYDADGDGISGRGHILSDGRLGRYGWKADIPSLGDFVADALIKELGMTVEPSLSDFTVVDDFDSCPDPELPDGDFQALLFFLKELEAPKGQEATIDGDPDAGAVLFEQVSCGKCHLASVPSYTDLLLHDVAPDPALLVDTFPDVLPTEYRTPPLWGLIHTGPYLHDGSAPTLEDAILMGHYGEAQGSRQAFESLSEQEKSNLLSFLSTL